MPQILENKTSQPACVLRPAGYCSRWEFILNRCRNRTVLHLGCVGETDASLETKIVAFTSNRSLHNRLAQTASELCGVDLDADAVCSIRSKLGPQHHLLVGDVEHLELLPLDAIFDVIVFGDLIEHISCPGLALNGIRRFMSKDSEVIISTPNAFSLMANIRFTLGRFKEGEEHVASYSKFTLATLLQRHRLELLELFTCVDRPPVSRRRRFEIAVGSPYFRRAPDRGGTLLAVAKQAS